MQARNDSFLPGKGRGGARLQVDERRQKMVIAMHSDISGLGIGMRRKDMA